MAQRPPNLAKRILLSFLRQDLAEEVLGDLDENFHLHLEKRGGFMAKLNYWYQVLNYLRPFAIRKTRLTNSIYFPMYKSYFIIAWRNLIKQKMYSSIKIGGFALGIAACLLITLYIQDEVSYDLHYKNKDQIFRVVGVFKGDEGVEKDVFSSAPFAQALQADYPEIEKGGRFNSGELFGAGANQIRRADKKENTYEEGFAFFDQELLDVFQLPFVYGNPHKALAQPNTLVISQKKADKYFPDENPVGKTMIINNDETHPYKIGGVIEDFPANSHIRFDFLMSLKGKEFWQGEQSYWLAGNYPTYVRIKKGTDVAALEKKLKGMVDKYIVPNMKKDGQNNAEELGKKASVELQPVTDIHLKSDGIQDGLSHGDLRFIWIFGAIAAFILIIAGINFINLSTARSANRAKEVGLRKVVGSHKINLVRQFLTESTLFSLISFLVGFLLAWGLLPLFNIISEKALVFPWTKWWTVPVLVSSSLVIGIIAGLYPAFYLSAFKPIQVLKGNISRGAKNSKTRSMLVVFQFTTSIVLLVGTFIIYKQMNYLLNRKVGFDKEQVILIHGVQTMGNEVFNFKNELLRLPQVSSVSVSDYLPVKGTKRNGNALWNGTAEEARQKGEKAVYGQVWVVDHNYVETLGMKIVEGRDFSPKLTTDSQTVIINKALAKKLNLKHPIGRKISTWRPWTVIGVVEDFNFESMKEEIQPLCLTLGKSTNIVSVKVKSTDISASLKGVSAVWKEFSPNQPIRYTFLNENFALMYKDVQRMGLIFTSFAVFAIIVACLGLFALSAFMVEQRSKEIGIRIVLGASVIQILQLLTHNFVRLILISIVIAIPVSVFIMQRWLDDYAYRIKIGWEIFAFAGLISLLIALVTISFQSVKAALAKPVESLNQQ